MRRSSFVVGVSNLIATGGLMIVSGATNSEDPLFGRFRAGDYLATPYAHVVANGGSNFAAPVSTAQAAIRAGSPAEPTAALLSADGMIARLYQIMVDNFPVMLLLVGTADGLTDTALFPTRTACIQSG